MIRVGRIWRQHRWFLIIFLGLLTMCVVYWGAGRYQWKLRHYRHLVGCRSCWGYQWQGVSTEPGFSDVGPGIGACKTIAAAQTDYNNNSKPYTYTDSLARLGNGYGAGGLAFVDPNLSSGLKSGYTFHLVGGSKIAASIWTWSAAAWPLCYRYSGVRSFYVDENGIIRGSDILGKPGTIGMPAID